MTVEIVSVLHVPQIAGTAGLIYVLPVGPDINAQRLDDRTRGTEWIRGQLK